MSFSKILTVVLLSVAIITLPATAIPKPSRNILWATLQFCILAKMTSGLTFPCLSVELSEQNRPGTAVLRAPGRRTHIVVMPTDDVPGVEAPELRGSAGVTYWQAALAARSLVTDSLKGRIQIDDVGVAVNSVGGRSQDQLHIHVDCVRPSVGKALKQFGPAVSSEWSLFPIALRGSKFYAKRVSDDQMANLNPFAAVNSEAFKGKHPGQTSFAIFNTQKYEGKSGYYILAYNDFESHAEKLLDHSCIFPD